MSRSAFCFVASLVLTTSSVAAAANATRVTVPGGTSLKVFIMDKVSSSTAKVGDTFAIQAADDVAVDGWVVVAKGAGGQGEVTMVDRAGKHGHPGSLGLQMDWIYDVDGHKIQLGTQKNTQEGESKAGESSTVTVLSAVFLGLPGLFAHNFVKGKDVETDSTKPIVTYVDDSVYVDATRKSANDPGFAPAVAPATVPHSTPKPPVMRTR